MADWVKPVLEIGKAAIASEYLPKVVEFAGDKLKKYHDRVSAATEEAVLDKLTERATGARSAESAKYKGSVGAPFKEGGKWVARMPMKEGSYPSWAAAAYQNPQTSAKIAGQVAPIAGLVAAGSVLGVMAGDKPRSAYSVPVQPSGGYNPNIEAANVSFQNRQALENQRFEHRMALERMREQARIPGRQNIDTGGYGGRPPGFGSTPAHEHDVTSILRGIYGSGMRL